MGLKNKLKDALHGDKDQYDNTTGTGSHATGSHPAGSHAAGSHAAGSHDAQYGVGPDSKYQSTAQHGTTGTTHGAHGTTHDPKYQNTNTNTTTTTTASGGHNRPYQADSNPQKYQPPYSSTTTNPTGKDAYGHRKQDSGVDFGATDRDDSLRRDNAHHDKPYWGNMEHDGPNPSRNTGGAHDTLNSAEGANSNLHRKELPLRPNEHSQTHPSSAVSGDRHRQQGLGGSNSPTGGTYNTVAGAGSQGYDSRLSGGRRDDNLPLDTGSYNPRGGDSLPAAGLHNQGSSQHASGDYDSRMRDRDMGRDTSRSGLGAAAAGAGAAGLAGAGLAGHHNSGRRDDLTRDDLDTSYGADRSRPYEAGGGAPQSSMLDPYHSGNANTHNLNQSRVGPHDSNVANKMDPRVDSDLDSRRGGQGVGPGVGAGAGAGLGAGVGAGLGAGHNQNQHGGNVPQQGAGGFTGQRNGGMGPDHFGPGHVGAKVMHTCVGCGLDNDISQYFRKDATYRMG